MEGALKVLLVEDNLEHAALFKDSLQKYNPRFEIDTISYQDNYQDKLAGNMNSYEAIIVDSHWANADVSAVLAILQRNEVRTPVVVVSNEETEQAAIEAWVQLQSQIMDSKNRLQTIFDGTQELIYQVNRNYEITAANRAFAAACNCEPKDLIGQKCQDVCLNDGHGCLVCPLKDVFETRSSKTIEKVYDNRFYEVVGQPVLSGDRVESVTVYCRDVTEKKMLERSLIQSEKMATVGLLSSGIAHEIRNPLNVIETARYYLTEFLQDKSSDVENKLEIIGKNVRRASRIIQNLLDFARNSKYDKEIINLTKLIQNTVSLVGKELTAKNIAFVFEPKEDTFVLFNIDSLKQVLLNLIINAIQAMPEGGKLFVNVKRDADLIELDITDTGVGISEKHLAQIFEPFFTTKEAGVGTGLGLYISKMIIEREGGSIAVKSKPDKGTTFTIALPITKEEESLTPKDDPADAIN